MLMQHVPSQGVTALTCNPIFCGHPWPAVNSSVETKPQITVDRFSLQVVKKDFCVIQQPRQWYAAVMSLKHRLHKREQQSCYRNMGRGGWKTKKKYISCKKFLWQLKFVLQEHRQFKTPFKWIQVNLCFQEDAWLSRTVEVGSSFPTHLAFAAGNCSTHR